MELWDLYDSNKNLTSKKIARGEPIPPGYYHIVVQVFIKNDQDRWLITKRDPKKKHPLLWEPTAGAVLSLETSAQAALREVKEETGIALDPRRGRLFRTFRYDQWEIPAFLDVYVFHDHTPIEKVVLQKGETIEAKWASAEEIHQMMENGQFIHNNQMDYYDDIFALNL